MRALSTVADVLEPAFAVLSIVAGIAVIFAALRLITKLILFSHRLISLSFLTAAIAIVASEVIEVFASISRPSTVADTAEEFTVLIAICSVGVALHLIGRAEREEVSPLIRWANFDELTGLASRSFFRRAASRRIDLSENHGAPLSCVVL